MKKKITDEQLRKAIRRFEQSRVKKCTKDTKSKG